MNPPPKFGPEIEQVRALKARSHFWAWGLAGKDAHSSSDSIKMYTLDTLMKMNGMHFHMSR
jgi:hypothetical protein